MSKFVSLYVSACRSAMRLDLGDAAGLTELSASVLAARHAMICCVCGRLLRSPTGPAQSTCHHYFCRACVGGKTRYMKGGCGWCKDATDFVANVQLESVIRCFRQLCVYLNGLISPLAKNGHELDTLLGVIHEAIEKQDNDDILLTSCSSPNDRHTNVTFSPTAATSPDISKSCHDSRGARMPKSNSAVQHRTVKRRRQHQPIDSPTKRAKSQAQTCVSPAHGSISVCLVTNVDGNASDLQFDDSLVETVTWSNGMDHDVEQHIDVEETLVDGIYDSRWSLLENPILAEHDYNKLTSFNAVSAVTLPAVTSISPSKVARLSPIKKSNSKKLSADKGSAARKPSLTIRQLSEVSGASGSIGVKISNGAVDNVVPRRQKSSVPKVKIGCRCAMATPAPGKLTCCGQRCPCYAAFHGCCPSCKCRGCRNPRGDPAKSPLLGAIVKTSSGGPAQPCNMPVFDSTSPVYGSVSKDHIVIHSPARFTAESVG